MTSPEQVETVQIEVKNWPDAVAKPRVIGRTTIRTYIVDPVATDRDKKFAQIAAYEPKRVRLQIIVVDSPIVVSHDMPKTIPDVSTSAIAPDGAHLPSGAMVYEFFGPDTLYINSISGGATTRVTVIKEYCDAGSS